MPLQLPTLDDRSYADLVAEALRLIPVHDPDWTNHNPSDPGITLLELFASLTETLLYRLDRITAENQRKFLKLLNGPDGKQGASLADDIRASVLAVRARERAVTAADFELIALENFNQWLAAMQRAEQTGAPLEEWWRITQLDRTQKANLPSEVPLVARAACVPSRNLDLATEEERRAAAPGHVSLVILRSDGDPLQPPDLQKAALWGYLDERRTLTTRHHVVGPFRAPVRPEIVIAAESGALLKNTNGRDGVLERVRERLARFLDPLSGGSAAAGWPFGRDVYVSELYEQIEAVEGVDYITDLMLTSECDAADARCVPAVPLWHPEGDLVGLALEAHQLPSLRLADAGIVVLPGAAFATVGVQVTLTASTSDPAALKRDAKAVARKFFHPRYDGPKPDAPEGTSLMAVDLADLLQAIPGVAAAAVEMNADAARLVVRDGQVIGVRIAAGEIVNWQTQVTVQNHDD